ncbi:unnamed protein product [Phaeothamnion confervicola]
MASLIIIAFTYTYSLLSSVSEFYRHTAFFYVKRKAWFERIALAYHILDNCVLVLLLTVITARLLRTATDFMDIALDAVVLYFIADIDKMLISEFDQAHLKQCFGRNAVRILQESGRSRDHCFMASRVRACAAARQAKSGSSSGNGGGSAKAKDMEGLWAYGVPAEHFATYDTYAGVALVVTAQVALVFAIIEYWQLF